MIHPKHIEKTLNKLKRLEQIYTACIFTEAAEVPVCFLETDAHLYEPPGEEENWRPAASGTEWGTAWGSAWFKGAFTVPEALDGKDLYIRAETDGVEAMLWKNGSPSGIFTHAREAENRGNHHTLLLASEARAGAVYDLALEAYAGHPVYGTQPYQTFASNDGGYHHRFTRVFRSVRIMLRRDDVMDFVFDLRALNQLAASEAVDGFRRAKVAEGLLQVFKLLVQSPEEASETVWRPQLAAARELMKPLLASRNGDSAPAAGLIGHSHMDTAWLWTRDETIRKCARTFANALSLMEQYPEYTFVQSSVFHAELMRRHYPSIFEGMKRRIAEGRWEPNGGVFVECDCNLVSGESMIRQFLKGQQYTRRHFGYTADTFWLPDTFGYSAAIPQIMAGVRVKYFLTTKLSWNDTNAFPYNTFRWRGLDGTPVLAHFNFIHCWPDAGSLIERIYGTGYFSNGAAVGGDRRYKAADAKRLISYGYGDGGGGPQYEMLESARRVKDLEGAPKAEHTLVSRFMGELETACPNPPVYAGELYFEGHRGTLTQLHPIKRNNRKAEFALRSLEFAEVWRRLHGLAPVGGDRREEWVELLLINQFHDILPGTSIPEVHDRAVREVGGVIRGAAERTRLLLGEAAGPAAGAVTVWNTLSWERRGVLALEGLPSGVWPTGYAAQRVRDLAGREKLLIGGAAVPAMGTLTIPLATENPADGATASSPFRLDGQRLETPHAVIGFDDNGYIASYVDKASGRELRRPGGLPLNVLLSGEDLPFAWDNWDIDRDAFGKLQPETRLEQRELAADGPLELRIRSRYRIGQHSSLAQDMVFRADSPRIDFETVIDWKDKHLLLKAGFDVNILAPSARHEIQFGHVERPTHRNASQEQGMFEVCAHKWSDLSEGRFGAALLNDCKYGVSVEGSDLKLTLHKGGTHPDYRGDEGVHELVYSFLPHSGSFSAENVIRPAYELNVPLLTAPGPCQPEHAFLAAIDAPNVLIETVKPAEEGDAYVLRLYEAERSAVIGAKLTLGQTPERAVLTNLLEEELEELPVTDCAIRLSFRPFEIKTVKVYYKSGEGEA